MPVPLVVPNAAQMRLIWSFGGQLYAINVLGVVANAVAITQAITNTVGAAVKTGFASSALNAALYTGVQLVNVGLRDVRTAHQAEFLDSGAAVTGTMAGDALPPQIALCITLRTAQAGASWRGRVYLPGFAEAFNAGGGTANSGTAAVAFVTAIKSALTTSGMDLGVLSRPNTAVNPLLTGFITPVTSIVCRDLVWDTQRRRAVAGI